MKLDDETSPTPADTPPPPHITAPVAPLTFTLPETDSPRLNVSTDPPQTDIKALGSLGLGILSLILLPALGTTHEVLIGLEFSSPFGVLRALSLMLLPGLAAAPAIILGHQSRSQIEKSDVQLGGDGMALAGLCLGYVSVALITIIMILTVNAVPKAMRARVARENFMAAYTVFSVSGEQAMYSHSHPEKGYAKDLASLGGNCDFVPGSPCSMYTDLYGPQCTVGTWCTKDGFKFTIVAQGAPVTDFVIAATPVNPHAGAESFCATSDGVSRKHSGSITKPPTIQECLTWAPVSFLRKDIPL